MTQNKTSGEKSGELQSMAGKGAAAELQKKAGGEFVDMQELLPVMSSFHEHLAAEQRKNQGRLRVMITLFVVLFSFFLIVPVYLGRQFLEQNRANLEAHSAGQEKLTASLAQAMASLTDASRDLRAELIRQHAFRAIEPAAQTSKPATVGVVAGPAESTPTPPSQQVEQQKPSEPAPVIEAPMVETPAVVAVPDISSIAQTQAMQGNLEDLLKQVEDAISAKETELKKRNR